MMVAVALWICSNSDKKYERKHNANRLVSYWILIWRGRQRAPVQVVRAAAGCSVSGSSAGSWPAPPGYKKTAEASPAEASLQSCPAGEAAPAQRAWRAHGEPKGAFLFSTNHPVFRRGAPLGPVEAGWQQQALKCWETREPEATKVYERQQREKSRGSPPLRGTCTSTSSTFTKVTAHARTKGINFLSWVLESGKSRSSTYAEALNGSVWSYISVPSSPSVHLHLVTQWRFVAGRSVFQNNEMHQQEVTLVMSVSMLSQLVLIAKTLWRLMIHEITVKGDFIKKNSKTLL